MQRIERHYKNHLEKLRCERKWQMRLNGDGKSAQLAEKWEEIKAREE